MKKTALFLALLSTAALARPEEGYRNPPPELKALVDAPNTPELSIDPRNQTLSQATRPGFLSIEQLSEPELKLAGLRFNPLTRASGRDKYYQSLELRPLRQGPARPVKGLPKKLRLASLRWSPDGKQLAFVNVARGGGQLWVADVASNTAHRVPGVLVNASLGFLVEWTPDGKNLLVMAVPDKQGPAPAASSVPTGPSIQDHEGGKATARTFQDLLKSPEDEKLFTYYLTSQPLLVSPDGKTRRNWGRPALYTGLSLSPSGQYLLAETVHTPFSYTVPISNFPTKTEVLDQSGKTVKVVADLPLDDNSPPDFDSVRTGPRSCDWRSDAPHTLFWVEAQDGGDARKAAPVRDQAFLWTPGGEAQPWVSLDQRFSGIQWGDDSHALLYEGWHKTRRSKALLLQPAQPSVAGKPYFDRSSEDRYADPGRPLTRTLPNGHGALVLKGDSVFLVGQGASPEGDRPFLDRYDLASGQSERLFRSQAPNFERPVRFLDTDQKELLITRENLETPPNLYVGDKALTQFVHPAPQLKGVKKEIIRYKRADGVDLTGTLYTPPGYNGGKLPVLIWAYPGEFKSAAAAGQIKDSPYRFIRPFWGGPLFFVMRGYAVLEDPTFPIIGEGKKEPNDTYVEQLVMDAQAAVDGVVATGVGDKDRCAIGGHSYGAFTTANLLAHSEIFRAGIARSGAYNRTLTPFGFQSEERTYWEVPDLYKRMSPFTYADKINEPLLMIHGGEDNNPGTFPMQSERLFQAVKGLGGRVRLVVLPKESHSYAARESVLHVFYEMDRWLEQHVKNAPPR
ncbi:MAG: S9 family peptidase [Candidatus Eremiobacteraeota bacterium]|nr:S9 family peptidase [Candidatus Eremiobacteraeota bacterium]